MSASEVLGRVSPQWEILKSLRRHRTRLWNETKYRRFNPAQTSVSEIERQNYLDLLENGLRNIMVRNDLDTLLDDGLDRAAMGRAHLHLKSLCDLMERNAINSSFSQYKLQGKASKYYRLDALLDELANTNWKFAMVSGTGRKLFGSISPEDDNKCVGNFNDFFSNLTHPSVADIHFPTKTLPLDDACPDTGHTQNQLAAAFDGLDVLLSQFKDPLDCKGHKVLLQLPELNIAASRERFRESRLQLFLSTCRVPSLWLESQLDTLSST
ncbi:hypothetical protein ABW20_dc0107126 [Dactylellina cionopaga]|nr:hypothetical protein ABW20_dc0107126 [Dactylellina cionopaga]